MPENIKAEEVQQREEDTIMALFREAESGHWSLDVKCIEKWESLHKHPHPKYL